MILGPIAAQPAIATRTRHPNTFFPNFNFTFFGNFIKVAFSDSTLPVLAPVLEPLEERAEEAEPGSGLGLRLRPLLLLLFLDPHRRLHEEGGGPRRDVEEHGGVGGLAGALRRRREVGERRSADVRRGVEGEEAGVLAEVVGALGGVFMEEGAAPPGLQRRVGSELGSLVCNVGFEVEGLLILSQELMQQRLLRHDCSELLQRWGGVIMAVTIVCVGYDAVGKRGKKKILKRFQNSMETAGGEVGLEKENFRSGERERERGFKWWNWFNVQRGSRQGG